MTTPPTSNNSPGDMGPFETPGGSAQAATGRPAKVPVRSRVAALLRTRILAGMVILVPLGVTALLTYNIGEFLYRRFQGFLEPNLTELGRAAPILRDILANDIVLAMAVVLVSLFVIGSVIYIAGFLSTSFVVRKLLALGEGIIRRIPVVNFLYGVLKQIMDTIATQREATTKMQRLVLVEYPRPGVYAIGFVTGETYVESSGKSFVNIFLPTTPNPTSGFLLLVAPHEVLDTNLSMEVGVKFIVSGGILVPKNLHTRRYSRADDGTFEEPALIADPLGLSDLPKA